jgi:hypothetical protein
MKILRKMTGTIIAAIITTTFVLNFMACTEKSPLAPQDVTVYAGTLSKKPTLKGQHC